MNEILNHVRLIRKEMKDDIKKTRKGRISSEALNAYARAQNVALKACVVELKYIRLRKGRTA